MEVTGRGGVSRSMVIGGWERDMDARNDYIR